MLLLPGLGNNAADYGPLAAKLEARGMAVEVAQVGQGVWAVGVDSGRVCACARGATCCGSFKGWR